MIVANEPDVILLDIVMPAVSGLDILADIRGDAVLAHIPVIILTASDDSAKPACKRSTWGRPISSSKPVDVVELVPRVRNACLGKIAP